MPIGASPVGRLPVDGLPASGGGNVTVALTQVAATGSLGTIKANIARSLTEDAATGSLGIVGVSRTNALTQTSATGSEGNLKAALSIALDQVTAAAAAGHVGAPVALTGVQALGILGIVTPLGGDVAKTGGAADEARRKWLEWARKRKAKSAAVPQVKQPEPRKVQIAPSVPDPERLPPLPAAALLAANLRAVQAQSLPVIATPVSAPISRTKSVRARAQARTVIQALADDERDIETLLLGL